MYLAGISRFTQYMPASANENSEKENDTRTFGRGTSFIQVTGMGDEPFRGKRMESRLAKSNLTWQPR
jgi:hypothetical protein